MFVKEKTEISEKVGKKLNEIRTNKGLTQEELAHEAGVNRAYIGYIERGERNPSIFVMSKIVKALQVNLFQLFQFNN